MGILDTPCSIGRKYREREDRLVQRATLVLRTNPILPSRQLRWQDPVCVCVSDSDAGGGTDVSVSVVCVCVIVIVCVCLSVSV